MRIRGITDVMNGVADGLFIEPAMAEYQLIGDPWMAVSLWRILFSRYVFG
jgi:hypothetical protein